MSYQYVYVMKGLSKSIGGKQILKETWLSFLPGAKIGIIGHNGAGKSTLLKIMAGLDKEYEGEAFVADGVKIGHLSQEPHLDPSKNVFENIMDGLAEKKALIDEFNEVSSKFAEEMTDVTFICDTFRIYCYFGLANKIKNFFTSNSTNLNKIY